MTKARDRFLEDAWEIARTVAAVDKQLLSTAAVEAFAALARNASADAKARAFEVVSAAHEAVGYCRITGGLDHKRLREAIAAFEEARL